MHAFLTKTFPTKHYTNVATQSENIYEQTRYRPQSDRDLSGFPDNIHVADIISRRYKRYSVTTVRTGIQ